MKYSQYIGLTCIIIILILCFQPWVVISSEELVITGFDSGLTRFGQPGKLHFYFCIPSALLFLLPYVWAKRTNLFFTAINLSWAVRNFIVLSACQAGECPEKQIALYLILVASAVILLMALLPKIKVNAKDSVVPSSS
jgi:hypothetical protein